jgi:hypothetical protein
MRSSSFKKPLRLAGAAFVISGAAMIAAYLARWWPYTHREDFHFTILSSDGRSFAASGMIPLPLIPCLLVGGGVAFWLASLSGALRGRRQ